MCLTTHNYQDSLGRDLNAVDYFVWLLIVVCEYVYAVCMYACVCVYECVRVLVVGRVLCAYFVCVHLHLHSFNLGRRSLLWPKSVC